MRDIELDPHELRVHHGLGVEESAAAASKDMNDAAKQAEELREAACYICAGTVISGLFTSGATCAPGCLLGGGACAAAGLASCESILHEGRLSAIHQTQARLAENPEASIERRNEQFASYQGNFDLLIDKLSELCQDLTNFISRLIYRDSP